MGQQGTAGAAQATRRDVRFRHFDVRVVRARPLSPSFMRVTFTGDDLDRFGVGGFDQRIKVILAGPSGSLDDVPTGDDWYARWRALPADRRPVVRTYTVRAARPRAAEVDIDFVLHGLDGGHAGPAARWAAAVRPGDRALLLGPDRPGGGRAWGCEWAPPPDATHLVIAGDETAAPAACAVLEALPTGVRATALLEVPLAADVLPVAAPAGVDLRWLPRSGGDHAPARPHGALLAAAVRAEVARIGPAATGAAPPDLDDDDTDLLWDVPDARAGVGGVYVWLAGEAGVVRALRGHLVGEVGLPRGSVACMGYWRQGRSEHD